MKLKDEPAKPRGPSHDEIIAAFDRERDEAHELQRKHSEAVINSRRNDRPVEPDDRERHR